MKQTSKLHIKITCVSLAFALSFFAFSPSALATLQEDQTPLSEEELQNAVENGAENTNFVEEEDATLLSEEEVTLASTTSPAVPSNVKVYAYSGSDMYATAAMEAKQAYPSGSQTAILAGSGDAWVDSLSATGLAASVGPILYSKKDELPASTLSALKQLGVKKVIIVGGTACISQAVVNTLASNSISLETRLSGDDCLKTQLAIYNYGVNKGYYTDEYLFVATSAHYADALSISPVAFAKKVPVFLVPKNGSFSNDQMKALIDQAKKGRFKKAVIAGGTSVVPDTTFGFLEGVTLVSSGSVNVTRCAGSDMYATSREIAKWSVDKMGFSWASPSLTTGLAPYDALAGTVLAGKQASPLLLADNNNTYTVQEMKSNKGSVKNIHFFGGEACISMRTRMQIADDIGFPWVAIPDYKVYVDAGHGWNDSNNGVWDSGATGSGYKEADLTKELAGKVNSILRNEYGISTFLNDDGGWYKLRHQEAINQGCDSLVSIHFNAGGGTGTESLIHNYNASGLSSSWQSSIHPKLIEGTTLKDRGKKTQEVAILGGYLPATLLEIAFIDNSSDMSIYQSRKDVIAHKIAEGIVAR